jgi:hypothetical protein
MGATCAARGAANSSENISALRMAHNSLQGLTRGTGCTFGCLVQFTRNNHQSPVQTGREAIMQKDFSRAEKH